MVITGRCYCGEIIQDQQAKFRAQFNAIAECQYITGAQILLLLFRRRFPLHKRHSSKFFREDLETPVKRFLP